MARLCDTCHAGCCRRLTVLITVYDALVIARDLALPIAEFVSFLPVSQEQIARLGGPHTPIVFSDPGQDAVRFFLLLKRTESALQPGTEKCVFLQEWTRQERIEARGLHPGARIVGRCGIYSSRPLICRTYPAFLNRQPAIGFVATPPPNHALESTHEIYRGCPEDWTSGHFAEDPSMTMHSLVASNYEIDFQNQAVAEWNSNPGAMKDFFPFMIRAYEHRLRTFPAPPAVDTVEEPKPIPL